MTKTDKPRDDEVIDGRIGSLLERWITRDTGEDCRFCGDHVGDVDAADRFCSDECSDEFDQVIDARVAIGSRDIDRRGFD